MILLWQRTVYESGLGVAESENGVDLSEAVVRAGSGNRAQAVEGDGDQAGHCGLGGEGGRGGQGVEAVLGEFGRRDVGAHVAGFDCFGEEVLEQLSSVRLESVLITSRSRKTETSFCEPGQSTWATCSGSDGVLMS